MAQPECPKCNTLMTMAVNCTVYLTDKAAELKFTGKTEDIASIYCPNCGWNLPKEVVKEIVPDEVLRGISEMAFTDIT